MGRNLVGRRFWGDFTPYSQQAEGAADWSDVRKKINSSILMLHDAVNLDVFKFSERTANRACMRGVGVEWTATSRSLGYGVTRHVRNISLGPIMTTAGGATRKTISGLNIRGTICSSTVISGKSSRPCYGRGSKRRPRGRSGSGVSATYWRDERCSPAVLDLLRSTHVGRAAPLVEESWDSGDEEEEAVKAGETEAGGAEERAE